MILRKLFHKNSYFQVYSNTQNVNKSSIQTVISYKASEEVQKFNRLINFDANYFDRVPFWLEPMDPAMVAIKELIVQTNNYVGLPWWAVLMISSVFVRLTIFPLILVQMRRMSKFGPVFPIFVLLKDTWKRSQLSKWQKIKLSIKLYRKITKEEGLKLSTVMVYNLAYYPMLISMIFAIRKLLSQPEIANSSFLYLNNLSDIDPYYILPTLTVGMYYWNFERFITPQNRDTLMSKVRIACQYFLILWYPFLCCWPSGIVIYMCTNAFMSIMQSNLMKKPWFLKKIAPQVVEYNYILTTIEYDKGMSDGLIESIKLGQQNFKAKAIKQQELVQQTQKMIMQLNKDSSQDISCRVDNVKGSDLKDKNRQESNSESRINNERQINSIFQNNLKEQKEEAGSNQKDSIKK